MIEKNKSEAIEIPVEVIPITPKPKINFRLVFIIILLLSLFSLGIVYAYNLGKQKNKPVGILPGPTEEIIPTIYSKNTPTETIEKTRFGELIWNEPKIIEKINIFQNKTNEFYGDPENQGKFYQIGKFSDGSQLILGQFPIDGPGLGGSNYLRFIKPPDNQINYITYGVDTWMIDSIKDIFLPNLNPINIQLSGLNSPDTITHEKYTFFKNYDAGKMLADLDKPIKVFDTVFGPIYEVIKPNILNDVDISGKIEAWS